MDHCRLSMESTGTLSDSEISHQLLDRSVATVGTRRYIRVNVSVLLHGVQEKIEAILELLHKWRWTIGDLLYYLFVMNGMTLKPSNRHCRAVAKFLTGETTYLLDVWFKSPYG